MPDLALYLGRALAKLWGSRAGCWPCPHCFVPALVSRAQPSLDPTGIFLSAALYFCQRIRSLPHIDPSPEWRTPRLRPSRPIGLWLKFTAAAVFVAVSSQCPLPIAWKSVAAYPHRRSRALVSAFSAGSAGVLTGKSSASCATSRGFYQTPPREHGYLQAAFAAEIGVPLMITGLRNLLDALESPR